MGVITDILTGIPLNAVLRERLVDKESYIATLEAENAVLKEKNAVLEMENAELKADLQNIESNKTVHGDICPYCQQPKGKLLNILPDSTFGDLGLNIHYYKCDDCGKEYNKERRR
ncbi:MAG: hypothetical protein WC454_05885 [Phycisphaerae bacterium]|jgi:hypothetical protein